VLYEGCSYQTGTFNFTGIKRDASVAVINAVVSGKCVQLLRGGTHVASQSRDKMTDNSGSASIEERVAMKFLVNV